jgi:hypothetical protein
MAEPPGDQGTAQHPTWIDRGRLHLQPLRPDRHLHRSDATGRGGGLGDDRIAMRRRCIRFEGVRIELAQERAASMASPPIS